MQRFLLIAIALALMLFMLPTISMAIEMPTPFATVKFSSSPPVVCDTSPPGQIQFAFTTVTPDQRGAPVTIVEQGITLTADGSTTIRRQFDAFKTADTRGAPGQNAFRGQIAGLLDETRTHSAYIITASRGAPSFDAQGYQIALQDGAHSTMTVQHFATIGRAISPITQGHPARVTEGAVARGCIQSDFGLDIMAYCVQSVSSQMMPSKSSIAKTSEIIAGTAKIAGAATTMTIMAKSTDVIPIVGGQKLS